MPSNNYIDEAINAALLNNWEKALELNQEILNKNPQDVDTLNRIAYAYLQMGKLKEAKKMYKKVIDLDNYNQIAKKNMLRLNCYKKTGPQLSKNSVPLRPSFFLEEPGKTKSISLINIAPFTALSPFTIGHEVYLCPKKHTVEVRDTNKTYIGALPDDIAFRLIRCLQAGNIYTVYIKNISKNTVSVFIKEIKRGNRLRNQPSFIPQLSDYQASLHKDALGDDGAEKKEEETLI